MMMFWKIQFTILIPNGIQQYPNIDENPLLDVRNQNSKIGYSMCQMHSKQTNLFAKYVVDQETVPCVAHEFLKFIYIEIDLFIHLGTELCLSRECACLPPLVIWSGHNPTWIQP